MRTARALLFDVAGGALLEFTLCAALLLFVLFASIEGGLVMSSWNQSAKAAQVAARQLVVRPPLAAGVPDARGKNPNRDSTTIRFGELCGGDSADDACGTVATQSCTIAIADGTTTCADTAGAETLLERMRRFSPIALRAGRAGTITVTYTDTGLGFVGGPYVPALTVRITGLRYEFVAMAGLSGLLGGEGDTGVDLPAITASLVGEDLAAGADG
jgi:Flp pilus assembly protein TadG